RSGSHDVRGSPRSPRRRHDGARTNPPCAAISVRETRRCSTLRHHHPLVWQPAERSPPTSEAWKRRCKTAQQSQRCTPRRRQGDDAVTRRPVEETAGPAAAPRYWHLVEWLLLSTAPACKFAFVICNRGSDAWSKSGWSWCVCRTCSNSHAACAVWRSHAPRRRCTGERCSSGEADELPAGDPRPSVRSDHALAVRRDGDRRQF